MVKRRDQQWRVQWTRISYWTFATFFVLFHRDFNHQHLLFSPFSLSLTNDSNRSSIMIALSIRNLDHLHNFPSHENMLSFYGNSWLLDACSEKLESVTFALWANKLLNLWCELFYYSSMRWEDKNLINMRSYKKKSWHHGDENTRLSRIAQLIGCAMKTNSAQFITHLQLLPQT